MQALLFEVKYFGATNTRGSRYRLSNYDHNREGKPITKWISFNYSANDQLNDNIIPLLEKSGFEILGKNTRYKGLDLVFCKWNWEALEQFYNVKGNK